MATERNNLNPMQTKQRKNSATNWTKANKILALIGMSCKHVLDGSS